MLYKHKSIKANISSQGEYNLILFFNGLFVSLLCKHLVSLGFDPKLYTRHSIHKGGHPLPIKLDFLLN